MMFFEFILDHTIHRVERVVVKADAGTWPLDDTLVFVLEEERRIQILIDVDSQEARFVDRGSVVIRGDYDDLRSHELVPHEFDVQLPDNARSVTEFAAENGKVLGCEIELATSGFALILDPEDCELRGYGGAWEYCRNYGIPQLGYVTVTRKRRSEMSSDRSDCSRC